MNTRENLSYVVEWNRGTTYDHTESSAPFAVYGYGKYPRSSVNYGMTRRVFMDAYATVLDALKAYPTASISPNLDGAFER